MQDKPIVGTTELLNKMSLELYEEEQLRNKVIWQLNLVKKISISALLALAIISLSPDSSRDDIVENILNIIFPIVMVILVGSFIFLVKSKEAKKRLDERFKEKIVTALIQNCYPSLVYVPKGSFSGKFVKKANRYNSFDGITINKTQDYLHGKLEGVDIKLMEIKDIIGYTRIGYPYQSPLHPNKPEDVSLKGNIFSGIIIVMDFHVDDKSKLQGIMNSSVVQNAIKELDKFWGSYPQVTVDEEGYCVIDISLTKGRQFLEVSQKEKLYSLEYFDALYKQLDLLLKIPVLVKQELENR